MTITAPDTGTIRARLEEVRQRIAACAERKGRAPEDITLIAVSKTHPVEMVREAVAAGARDFGENRVQEAEEKIPALQGTGARWHLIGHLQSNKARRAVRLFDVIHSIDSLSLVERLERLCVEKARERLPVLVQVDLAGEATKAGAAETELPAFVEKLKTCERLQLVGLMTLPPFFAEVERVRPYFRRLRELRDELQRHDAFGDGGMGELSMGMSHDYEVAIAEGATMVRVGTSIFGTRNKV
ncbi:MAG: YggS family pyridoxal phosphate-dependent enzyme [Acidobacteriota bacterium]|nr:YggS family pyridoxal phosphate-dependent enzyme [Acidobacteriota bacterium]